VRFTGPGLRAFFRQGLTSDSDPSIRYGMRTSYYIPKDLAEEVGTIARQDGRSASAVVQEAIRFYLTESRRRRAGEALTRVAAETREHTDAGAALIELENDRHASDRT
jgi:metal-responsive CopG/Arc/MetJ family transcriptional regulator